MNIYKSVIKPILFRFDPEFIHDSFTLSGKILGNVPIARDILSMCFEYKSPVIEQEIFGKQYLSPVGLAAGFDYNGRLTKILHRIGFGFESVGTVTNKYYGGNIKPRLGRLPKSESLLVNKGFKSDGIQKVLNTNIQSWNDRFNVGISVGATNSKECSTPNAQIDDILQSVRYLKQHSLYSKFAYLEINISCPNVLGSGSLANPENLDKVLKGIREIGIDLPLFVKFQLEIDWSDAKELIEIMIKYSVDAIIIANLLKHRDINRFDNEELEKFKELKGNFSGKPTWKLSNELIKNTYREFGDRIKIIGLGGIFNAQDAYTKIRLGASLVQLITGMIFEGPGLIKEINKGLEELIKQDGYTHISQVIGIDSK